MEPVTDATEIPSGSLLIFQSKHHERFTEFWTVFKVTWLEPSGKALYFEGFDHKRKKPDGRYLSVTHTDYFPFVIYPE